MHLLGILFLTINFSSHSKVPTPQKKLVVKAISLEPKKERKESKKLVAVAPKRKLVKKEKPKKKKKVVAKKTKSKNLKREKLLKQVKESLANIESSNDKIVAKKKSESNFPKPIKQLSNSSTLTKEEKGYQSGLVNYLQAQLTLPELGMVKVKLLIDRSGKVMECVVKSSESSLNKEYIEEMLPKLTLPTFDHYFKGESSHLFHLTLTND